MKAFLLKYRVVDVLTLALALAWFVSQYLNVPALFAGVSVAQVLVIVLTALLVHVLKATRLFLALYGQKISISEHLALYCKVTPVSMVLPYKVGEFYRMYAYGTHLKSGLKGIVIILLDRFMDTAALVTMILIAGFFYGGQITSFLLVLLIFLVLVVLLYRAFPGARKFWKHYFLSKKATPRRMGALKALESFHRIYEEVSVVTSGRGILLYVLSFLAWGVEIGSIVLQTKLFFGGAVAETMSAYLASAMSGDPTVPLRQFIFVSVILLLVLFVIIQCARAFSKKKG